RADPGAGRGVPAAARPAVDVEVAVGAAHDEITAPVAVEVPRRDELRDAGACGDARGDDPLEVALALVGVPQELAVPRAHRVQVLTAARPARRDDPRERLPAGPDLRPAPHPARAVPRVEEEPPGGVPCDDVAAAAVVVHVADAHDGGHDLPARP